jgi:hypothetical protein
LPCDWLPQFGGPAECIHCPFKVSADEGFHAGVAERDRPVAVGLDLFAYLVGVPVAS